MSQEYPPDIPESEEELDRAVMLLGALAKGQKLKAKKLAELEELIGISNITPECAALWKSNLKKWRQERTSL